MGLGILRVQRYRFIEVLESPVKIVFSPVSNAAIVIGVGMLGGLGQMALL